jgi:hypothetical protein
MDHAPSGEHAGQSPAATYDTRCAAFGRLRDTYERRSNVNGYVSVALLVALATCAGLWLYRGSPALLWAAGAAGLLFVVSFVHHGRVNMTLRRYAELYAINDEGRARLRRDWEALPLRQPQPHRAARRLGGGAGAYGQIFAPLAPRAPAAAAEGGPDETPAHAVDLDLLGHASLQHLLNTPATPIGLATLRDWLLAPAPAGVARARQPAVAELAPLNDFRDQLALRGRLMGTAQLDYERFLGWAEGRAWLPQRAWLLWLARLLPLVTLGLALAQNVGLVAAPLWLLPIAVGVVLTQTACRGADAIIEEIAARQGVFATYADIFRLIGTQPFATPALRWLQAELAAGELRADQQMRRLGRLMALADLREWMFFYPIQIATLWNVHVLWLLERWQREAGGAARGWLAILGELEALAALATLAHDNPGWVFPELRDLAAREGDDGAAPAGRPDATITARGLAHPLLPPDVRVGNDVTIGPPGSFLLVTGSNMSGKSTLLRASGVNVTLAQAGGPICAGEMRLPPVVLATSMRVQDSLERGVSYFMAELQRLKEVVDTAERASACGERTPLFLLDEILHGTNTAERQIAARRIILHLLARGATGAVSTHDLTLADAPDLAARSRTVHFSEQFERGPDGLTMRFDYRLRPGIAESTNALQLMEMIGLPAGEPIGDGSR